MWQGCISKKCNPALTCLVVAIGQRCVLPAASSRLQLCLNFIAKGATSFLGWCFWWLCLLRLSQQRTTPLAPGVSAQFDPNDLAVTLHECSRTGSAEHDGDCAIYSEPWQALQKSWNPCMVLTNLMSAALTDEESSRVISPWFIARMSWALL